MEIDNFLEMPMLIGIIFLVLGTIFYFFPPKKINWLYGYRTSRSMKNQENWRFAQKYSSIKMLLSGFFLMLISCLGFFKTIEDNTQKVIGIVTLVVVIGYLFFKIEKALKVKFPNT